MRNFEGRLKVLIEYFHRTCTDSTQVAEVLRRSGISQKTRRELGEISPLEEAQFVREACKNLDDQLFGAKAGLATKETDSLTSYIGKFSETLGKAIENSQRFYPALDPAQTFSLRVSGNSASLEFDRIDISYEKFHRYTEFLMFGALGRMRTLTQSKFFPIEVRFRHKVKSNGVDFCRLVEFPVVFETEKTEMILPLSALDLRIPTYNPAIRNHLMEYGERLLSELPATVPSLRASIEGLLLNSLPGKIVSAQDVASGLGMSRRTFARRLNEEGLSFRGIVDKLRCDLAKTYLTGGFSISEISFYLDYADQAAFSTAFKRWTGESPSEYRKSALS